MDLLEYLKHTPENTNLNIVKSMIENNGSGSNPNSIQVITSTLDAIFADVDYPKLCRAIYNNNATALCECDGSVLGAGTVKFYFKCSNGNELYAEGGSVGVLDNITQAFYVSFDSTGTLTDYKMGQNGTVTNLISYASQIPTTLTIIWHPVVEEVEPEPEPSPTPSSEPSTK